jgi:hypothetical protein
VQMEIIGRGRHKISLYEDGVVCGFLWTLTPRKGLCDTRGGTTGNFLHSTACQNKSGGPPRGKRDCADNPLDKLPTAARKPLKLADLSEAARALREMLMDVNKRASTGGRNLVSPIHRHIDSNLKNLRFLFEKGATDG